MCEFNEKEIDQDMEEKTLEDMSKDELIDVVCQLMEIKDKEIEINTDDIQGIKIDPKEFAKGVKSMSFMAGQYSVLKSVGIDSTSAIDMIVNERNVEYNLKLNEMTCINNREIANIQQTIQEQNQP